MPDQPQVSRQRQPYERRSEQRNDRSDTSYYAPKQRPRHTAQPIADQSDRPLYDREQGNADCIRTDDHHHFARKLLSNRPIKRDELAQIALHLPTADQHKIENEQQHHHIDRKAADALQYPLPGPRQQLHQFGDIIPVQQVIADPLSNQLRQVPNGLNNSRGIEGHILQFSDKQPHEQRQRNQKTDDGFTDQQRSGQATPQFMADRQRPHLPAQQYINRKGSQQAAQKGNQFYKNNRTQPQKNDIERIAPIFLPDILFLDSLIHSQVYLFSTQQDICRSPCRTQVPAADSLKTTKALPAKQPQSPRNGAICRRTSQRP